MAQQQNGYAVVPHGTYNEYRAYALSHGVNVDYSWGNQCWDICALLWWQYGLSLKTGPNHCAYECWTVNRNYNAKSPFKQISRKEDIKRGDVVVFNKYGSFYTGHIAIADEDYHGNTLKILGQNQGQGTSSGTPSNIINKSMSTFLGAFRNTKWQTTPPTPPTPGPASNFGTKYPWVLYADKLRKSRM